MRADPLTAALQRADMARTRRARDEALCNRLAVEAGLAEARRRVAEREVRLKIVGHPAVRRRLFVLLAAEEALVRDLEEILGERLGREAVAIATCMASRLKP